MELHQSYGSLTPREREVMVLVVSGLLNKQVGGDPLEFCAATEEES